MARAAAGLLVYRIHEGAIEVLLAHPGGPFWARKDAGAWTIPKGEPESDEDPLVAARREFREETGIAIEDAEFVPLAPRKQRSGKTILAWAVQGNLETSAVRSNTFLMEWPPRSGQQREFPEVDRVEWFPISVAREKIATSQRGFLDELERIVGTRGGRGTSITRLSAERTPSKVSNRSPQDDEL